MRRQSEAATALWIAETKHPVGTAPGTDLQAQYLGGVAANQRCELDGKPEAYRYVRRQSRGSDLSSAPRS